MKIGIIGINIYPKFLNFACGLHTYAFQQFLLQNDIENTIIDYKPVYFYGFDMEHPSDYYKEKYNEQLKKIGSFSSNKVKAYEKLSSLKEKIDEWEPLYAEREIRYKKYNDFIEKNYIKTDKTYDSDLLEIEDPGFDCYMCVTDVIWKVLDKHTFDRGFFLSSKSMENKEKIAYAASRGVPKEQKEKEKKLFFRYLEDINNISVREASLKKYIDDNSNLQSTLVLDPVMLHNKSFWQNISIKPKEDKYILLYYVMEQATQTISKTVEYAKKHDLTIVELSDRPVKNGRINDPGVKHISRYDIGMEEWLGYIEHAECIFTNSFHGCCFSILFEKQFFVGKRDGDKVTNILDIFDLRKQLMKNDDDVALYNSNIIDYNIVNDILDKERAASQSFILNAIEESKKRFESKATKDNSKQDSYRKSLTYKVKYQNPQTVNFNDWPSFKKDESISKKRAVNTVYEYLIKGKKYTNDGTATFDKNKFSTKGLIFTGWTLSVKIDNSWFWYMNDNTLKNEETYTGDYFDLDKKLFVDEGTIPHLPVNRISSVIAEANWDYDDTAELTEKPTFSKRVINKLRRMLT